MLNSLDSEEDPFVLWSAVKYLANEMKKDPKVAEFIFKMADHENFKIRYQAAMAIGNTWTIGVDGATDKIIDMMDDENDSVKAVAMQYSGRLHDEKVIEPLKKVLKNADMKDFHDECASALTTMWYDYPFHEHTSKKA